MDAVATAKLALDASGFDRGLKSAQSSVASFAKQAGSALAGAFAFNKIIQGFSTAIEKADQLQDIAEKFGVSASKLQLLGNAASVFGSGIEQVSAGLNKLSLAQQKALAGDKGLEGSFAEVGLSLDELRRMKPENILLKISDSFASGANEGRQFIIVNELLGKAQSDLIKVLNQGSDAIIKQGESMGVLTDDQIASLSEMSDAIKTLQVTVQNAFGTMAVQIVPVIKETQTLLDLFGQFLAVGQELGKFNFSGAKAIFGGMSRSESKARLAQESQKVSPAPRGLDTSAEMLEVSEEKKKQDKRIFDEEMFDLLESSKLEDSRDKTLFDRMMRDAEYARDGKKQILDIEKQTADKNREIILRGMEASGTILDKARASAERLGNTNLVNQIDRERATQQRETDVGLLKGLGARSDNFGPRDNKQIQALTQTEGELQRSQNSALLKSFTDMQGLVNRISAQIDKRLGVPILRSAN